MTNAIELKSYDVDGIELYVSTDGAITGMSITGLALCCGISRTSLQKMLVSGGATKEGVSTELEILKPFGGNYFVDLEGVQLTIENNAKIVKSDVCAVVIEYYAFESRSKNAVALNCYRSFAKLGIENWIKNVTGFKSVMVSDDKLDQILNVILPFAEELRNVKNELVEMRPIVEEYKTVKNGIQTSFKGLETVVNALKDEHNKRFLNGGSMSLTEWLMTKHIYLDHGGIRKFGRMVSETFRSVSQSEPEKSNRKKANGKWSTHVKVYSPEHFPILEMALEQYLRE